MSYCRFAWDGSDVYVYESDQGFECCGCKLGGWTARTPEAMIAHLAEHRRAGHFVPEYAITGLWIDIPGADKPVTPEPEEMTKAKALLKAAEPGLEVRLNPDGTLDEVVAPGFHLEQMYDTAWWMRVSCGKQAVVVKLFTKGRRDRPVLATWNNESEEADPFVQGREFPVGARVIIEKASGHTLDEVIPGAKPVGLADPTPEHIGKEGEIAGELYQTHMPVIELDDGTILLGSQCWWSYK